MKKPQKQNLAQKIKELEDGWKRTQADFENYRKHSEAERGEILNLMKADFMAKIAPVLDNFRRAFIHAPVSPGASRGGPRESKKVALRATFAGLVAWLLASNIIGRAINRPRPFESSGVHEILFHRPTYSFPSDHAAFLFALSFSFWLSGYKKLATVVFIASLLIGAARIAVGVHFPSDIISGAILGIFIARLIHLFDRPLEIVYNFIINIAKSTKLA